MRSLTVVMVVFFLALASGGSVPAQDAPDEEKVWSGFLAWAKAAPADATLKAFSAKLAKDGFSEAEIERQLSVVRRLFSERPEAIELIYDRIYSKTLTGDPEKDGFNSNPNSFLVEATAKLEPGAALDVGAGQGRNAVHLAQAGWTVTGVDISGAGLTAARHNAEKAGVRIETVQTTYEAYDFGVNRWDLIAMILSWAPVEDEAFVAKLNRSLRPGGALVFEHVIQRKENPFPKYVHALPSEALKKYFRDLRIDRYEEVTVLGDWGGPPALLVRMVARKP